MIKKRMNKRGGSRFDFLIGKGNIVKSKRSMELEEIGKIILAVCLLALLLLGIWLLIKGKGGDALTAIKNLLRRGR